MVTKIKNPQKHLTKHLTNFMSTKTLNQRIFFNGTSKISGDVFISLAHFPFLNLALDTSHIGWGWYPGGQRATRLGGDSSRTLVCSSVTSVLREGGGGCSEWNDSAKYANSSSVVFFLSRLPNASLLLLLDGGSKHGRERGGGMI